MLQAKRIAHLALRIMRLILVCAFSICWVMTGCSSEAEESKDPQPAVAQQNPVPRWGPEPWESITDWRSVTNWHHITVGMTKNEVLTVFKDAIPRDRLKERLAKERWVAVGTVRPSDSELQLDTWMVETTTGFQGGYPFVYGRLTFVKDKLYNIEAGFFPEPKSEPPLEKLGYPPGKVITVEGVRCDNCKFSSQMLAVSKVEGKPLAEPVDLDLAGSDLAGLPGGVTIILTGYTGFEKNREFVVTKIITPKSWKPERRPDLWSE